MIPLRWFWGTPCMNRPEYAVCRRQWGNQSFSEEHCDFSKLCQNGCSVLGSTVNYIYVTVSYSMLFQGKFPWNQHSPRSYPTSFSNLELLKGQPALMGSQLLAVGWPRKARSPRDTDPKNCEECFHHRDTDSFPVVITTTTLFSRKFAKDDQWKIQRYILWEFLPTNPGWCYGNPLPTILGPFQPTLDLDLRHLYHTADGAHSTAAARGRCRGASWNSGSNAVALAACEGKICPYKYNRSFLWKEKHHSFVSLQMPHVIIRRPLLLAVKRERWVLKLSEDALTPCFPSGEWVAMWRRPGFIQASTVKLRFMALEWIHVRYHRPCPETPVVR